jgi:proteic killer suppression protein
LSLYTSGCDPSLSTSRLAPPYEDDDRRELNPQHADKIARTLARLDVATRPEQLDLPGFRLHPLKGELAGYWSITVRANWRIIFRFEEGDATDVDLVDYH